jgi:lysyl-tRNA synthetase class 2
MAYADYLQVMELTEQMFVFVAERVAGRRTLTYQGQEISLDAPWQRLELSQALRQFAEIDIEQHPTAESLAAS